MNKEDKVWLIWSNYHKCWWASDERGYTEDRNMAGRYDLITAINICARRSPMIEVGYREIPPEVIVPSPELVHKILFPEGEKIFPKEPVAQ